MQGSTLPTSAYSLWRKLQRDDEERRKRISRKSYAMQSDDYFFYLIKYLQGFMFIYYYIITILYTKLVFKTRKDSYVTLWLMLMLCIGLYPLLYKL